MKFGVCVNMLKNTPTDTGIGFVEKIAEFGYDYIELPLYEIMMLSEAEFDGLKARLKSARIPCRVCNNFFPKNLKLTGPDVDHKSVRKYYTAAIKRASLLGVKFIVFGSPWAKAVPVGFSKNEAYQQLVELNKEIASVAAKYNIVIALEHNNKAETNILNQLHEVGKLAECVNHPNIKVLVDYFHIAAENEPILNVVHYGANIVHTHFARYEGRRYPKDMSEDKNYQTFINALKRIHYDGGVSIEAYSDDFDLDALATLKFFKENFK